MGRIFEHWKKTFEHPNAKLDVKRRRLISTRLKVYDEATLIEAIAGYAKSDWHMGRDPSASGKRNDHIELILRDSEHVERGLAFTRSEPKRNGAQPPRKSWREIAEADPRKRPDETADEFLTRIEDEAKAAEVAAERERVAGVRAARAGTGT